MMSLAATLPCARVKVADSTAEIVELAYVGEKYAAVVVLPDASISLDDVVVTLSKGRDKLWTSWMRALVLDKFDQFGLPRFRFQYGVQSVKSELQAFGVIAPFEQNATALPFGQMTADPDAYLDDVLHVASLECSEDGTVATAVTAAVVMTRSLPLPGRRLIVDRPFLFAIRDRESGALLFVGRVDKPLPL